MWKQLIRFNNKTTPVTATIPTFFHKSILNCRTTRYYTNTSTIMNSIRNNGIDGNVVESPQITLNDTEFKIVQLIKKYINHYNTDLSKKEAHQEPLVARISGGWVRDKLLERQSHDLDIAVNLMSGQDFVYGMMLYYSSPNLLPECIGETTPFHHNINTIKKNPEKSKHLETTTTKICGLDIDFVNLRNEKYTTESRIPIVTNGTPEEDAIRRDCTLNALFYNISTDKVEDFTRCGLKDLQHGIIRTPMDPLQTFMDDPLRILRLIRFSAVYGFQLDSSITKCFQDNHSELVVALQKKISKERIGIELMKFLDHGFESCCKGFSICCEFDLLGCIFHHSFDDSIVELNLSNENNDIEKINNIYEKREMDSNCKKYIIENKEFPWIEQSVTGNEVLGNEKNVENKILLFCCILSVFEKIHIYTSVKNKSMKNLKNSMAEWILRDTLRFGKQYYQPVALIVENITSLHEFISANMPGYSLKRSDLCTKVILYESHLKIALNLERILHGDQYYNAIIKEIESQKLWEEYLVKPLINGKELCKILNKKPGTWMSEFIKKILTWQYDNPNGTATELKNEFSNWEI